MSLCGRGGKFIVKFNLGILLPEESDIGVIKFLDIGLFVALKLIIGYI